MSVDKTSGREVLGEDVCWLILSVYTLNIIPRSLDTVANPVVEDVEVFVQRSNCVRLGDGDGSAVVTEDDHRCDRSETEFFE